MPPGRFHEIAEGRLHAGEEVVQGVQDSLGHVPEQVGLMDHHDIRRVLGGQGGGELRVVVVEFHRVGLRDDTRMGPVEFSDHGVEELSVSSGEQRPERDLHRPPGSCVFLAPRERRGQAETG
jgi:hypothetical protein